MEYKTRRQFLKTAGILTAGALISPYELFASTKTHEQIIEELYNEPKHILLARMIFGEGTGISNSEKITIGFTPINRVKKKIRGDNLKKVILANKQYSCFNQGNPNLKRLRNTYSNMKEFKEYLKCRRISENILRGKYDQYNFGPTHYHLQNIEKPDWARDKRMKELDSTGYAHQFYIKC